MTKLYFKIDFAQLTNHILTILPNLKDVAGLEDAQLIFNFPYICLQFFSPGEPCLYPAKFVDKCMRKLKN